MKIEILTLNEDSKKFYARGIQDLENFAIYPYGDDFFQIDHGENYFSFFERLGHVTFRVALYQDKVVACAAGVLRTLSFKGKYFKAWYLCDLKVHPDFRGQRIPSKLFRKNLLNCYLKCGRGYALSMNPPTGENKVVRLLKTFTWLPFRQSGIINFYNLTYSQLIEFTDKNNLPPQFFLSLKGKKDLILKRNGASMNLLHSQGEQFLEGHGVGPMPDHDHMYCALKGSSWDRLLAEVVLPQASASLISHRMSHVDWDFILTSDI